MTDATEQAMVDAVVIRRLREQNAALLAALEVLANPPPIHPDDYDVDDREYVRGLERAREIAAGRARAAIAQAKEDTVDEHGEITPADGSWMFDEGAQEDAE